MKKGLGYNIILLITLTILLKCVGFVNRIIIANYFGTSKLADIYYSASGFIDSISAILLASLTVGVINIYIYNQDAKKNDKFVSNLLVIVLILMAFVGFVVMLLSDKIAVLLAPNYIGNDHLRIKKMLMLMSITFPFQGLIAVNSAVLQAEKVFAPVKLTGTVASIISILCVIWLANQYGITALVVSYLGGIILNSIFLFMNAKKFHKFKPHCVLNDTDIKKLLFLIFPLLVGTAGHEINLIIDKSIASQVAQGAISALSYSCVLYLFVENVVINSIITAIFPEMAERISKNDIQNMAKSTQNIILLAECLLIPITICTIFTSEDITRIAYMRGSFDETSLKLTSAALRGYMLGLPFLALRDIITRVYYAYGDTWKPVIINLISVILNICMDILLSRFWGIFGISIATALSIAVSSIWLFCDVKTHNTEIKNSYIKKEMLIILVALIPSIVLNIICVKFTRGIFCIILSIAVSIIAECIISVIFKSNFYKEICLNLKMKVKGSA